MTEDEKRELIAGRIMEKQLAKRLILLESHYQQKIEQLEAEVQVATDKAMYFWKALLNIRRSVVEVL